MDERGGEEANVMGRLWIGRMEGRCRGRMRVRF
jgi:hypothetical protein